MAANDIVKEVVSNVEGAMGCAIVDLNTGLLIAVYHTVPFFTQSYIDAVAATSVDMFRGDTVKTVEKLLELQRGESLSKSIKEVQMTTDNTLHFFATVPAKPDALMVLITTRKTNIGMGWAAVRSAIKEVAPFCP